MMERSCWVLVSLTSLSACGMSGDDFDTGSGSFGGEGGAVSGGLDEREVDRAAVMPPPISGGTLLVASDGDLLIAADPDRDVVHVASLGSGKGTATIALMPGDQPGRVIEDEDGIIHVVLRGAAAIASIDPELGTVIARNDTCANPRGIALDAGDDAVVVACAGGELVTHAIGGAIRSRTRVDTDLRDVIVRDGHMLASRFRSTELLTVERGGAVIDRLTPRKSSDVRVPGTAWRTRATPDGGWLMVHQSTLTTPLNVEPVGPSSGGSYGGSDPGNSGGDPPLLGCDGPVSAVLTMGLPSGEVVSSELLTFSSLPVDAAVSPDGRRIAVAIAGQHDASSQTMRRQRGLALLNTAMLSAEPDGDCHDPEDVPIPGHVVSVAFVDDDTVVAQSREPAALYVVTLEDRSVSKIKLEGDARFDTGHDLFHQDAGVGLSCASCHPEGGDDGKVWLFDPGKLPRRTQPLQIGLAGTEPFHWSGELADFTTLTHEIHTMRMGAAEQSPERVEAFEEWLFELPLVRPERAAEDEAALRGRELFVAVGCEDCHYEDALFEGKTANIRGEELQVPSLLGVALRPPFMHDGRYTDLPTAVTGMLVETAPAETLAPDELDAVVAYLETL